MPHRLAEEVTTTMTPTIDVGLHDPTRPEVTVIAHLLRRAMIPTTIVVALLGRTRVVLQSTRILTTIAVDHHHGRTPTVLRSTTIHHHVVHLLRLRIPMILTQMVLGVELTIVRFRQDRLRHVAEALRLLGEVAMMQAMVTVAATGDYFLPYHLPNVDEGSLTFLEHKLVWSAHNAEVSATYEDDQKMRYRPSAVRLGAGVEDLSE